MNTLNEYVEWIIFAKKIIFQDKFYNILQSDRSVKIFNCQRILFAENNKYEKIKYAKIQNQTKIFCR